MSKTVFSIIIICSMMLFASPAAGQANTNNALEKMKTDVYRFGTGEKAKVVVKMNDGTKHKGFILRTGDDSFDLADSKTKKSTSIAYRDVSQIKKPGLSKTAWALIGAGVAAAVVVAVIAVAAKNSFPDTISIGRPQ